MLFAHASIQKCSPLVALTSTESQSFFSTALINDQLLGTAMSPSSQTQCSSFFKNVNVCQQLLHRGNKNPWERSGVPWIQKVWPSLLLFAGKSDFCNSDHNIVTIHQRSQRLYPPIFWLLSGFPNTLSQKSFFYSKAWVRSPICFGHPFKKAYLAFIPVTEFCVVSSIAYALFWNAVILLSLLYNCDPLELSFVFPAFISQAVL